MLKNTFCHIPGISLQKETKLWNDGIHSWEQLAKIFNNFRIEKYIEHSIQCVEKNDLNFFAENLPVKEHWRLFKDFRQNAVYLDIETTGMKYSIDYITTIAIYDGREIKYFVNGDNLHQFPFEIQNYNLLITYNGKCFDVPFIEKFFGINLNMVHIDLRYLLKSLGYVGGLKACERKLGISRHLLEDVDGFFAVYLWNEYKNKKNKKALETLLAYNIQDVLNLEKLMVISYNMKLQNTPFTEIHKLPLPNLPANPFTPDNKTIERIRNKLSSWNFKW
ncbi:MAG: hypothetical protein IGBAC_0708 [Ignavibacteriae bacterium]|nr:MAG: hypothetical protein IGBAC_0708 [Ignavibacteriota bacterium]